MSEQNVCVQEEVKNLKRQLSVARNEISNLRQMLRNMGVSQQKEVDKIQVFLENWHCSKCQNLAKTNDPLDDQTSNNSILKFQPIGEISTNYPKKRAIPRQPGIGFNSQGKIILFNSVFTNPEHSLQGLSEFSHMWILFYFHMNESCHIKAKVSPPRLNGIRTGVFGTRSPHRPCPIGLSLVQIDRVEGSTIHFSGVDMMNGTPVLDLKPYIPQYDNPLELCEEESPELSRQLEGQESVRPQPAPVQSVVEEQREAPDGEECEEGNSRTSIQSPVSSQRHIRVPAWIAQPPVHQLTVSFVSQAECDLATHCGENNMKNVISDVLREDPRSVYVRERYANQFYTFLIQNLHVSCKFDDTTHSVKVYRIRLAGKLCDCGQPEWQCSIHNGIVDS
uniref:TsaA-like domain-containing protein n=1 Tax=Clastoptera arizonana TaxID=38151 RepID=A0A1B6D5Q2_9HEMI